MSCFGFDNGHAHAIKNIGKHVGINMITGELYLHFDSREITIKYQYNHKIYPNKSK